MGVQELKAELVETFSACVCVCTCVYMCTHASQNISWKLNHFLETDIKNVSQI